MKMKQRFLIFLVSAATFFCAFLYRPVKESEATIANYVVDTLATGLTVPWAIVFLPDKSMLFSERNGKIRLFRNGKLLSKPALLVSQIDTTRKMGLLGICIHPQFATNRYVYISYNYRYRDTPFLRVARYRFERDSLQDPDVMIESIYASSNHTGCRLKFGPDGKLYITTGDADRPRLAQDLKSLNGKILRVNDDGSIPTDNPFVESDTARKEIWSYGHRNTQGIAFQPGTGDLYNSEHGPTGGDEINKINKGANYGWPVIHHRDVKEGMVSPLLEYSPSIGPSEILFYNGAAFPSLKGAMLLASLRGESIIRISFSKPGLAAQEVLLKETYGRIRALTAGPDGALYFSTSQNDPPEGKPRPGYDMLLRLRPAGAANGQKKVLVKNRVSSGKASMKNQSSKNLYQQLCAGCHGANLEGSERATSLRDNQWMYGSTRKDLIRSIREGIVEKGMPAWEGAITDKEIANLADLVLATAQKKP